MKPIVTLSRLRLVGVFLCAATVYAIGAATRAGVPGMVFDVLRAELGFSAAQTAMISSCGVFGCMAFLSLAGACIDRFGWRRVILAGVFFQVFGEWLLYAHRDYGVILAGSFLNGGGRTIGYLALLKLLDVECDRRFFSLLIGVFYVFSYGGTLAGSTLFAGLATPGAWQDLLRLCNHLTLACGVAAALGLWNLPTRHTSALRTQAPNAGAPSPHADPHASLVPPPDGFFAQLRRADCRAALYCTAVGILIYWTLLAVVTKKYLADLCGGELRPMTVMNALVMLEMVFGGMVSFLCGNRRRPFQVAGVALLSFACASLLAGALAPAAAPVCAWIGFPALGAGYGLTCIQICALREFVPPSVSARAIAGANFCANVGIITLTQTAGFVYDRLRVPNSLAVPPRGYAVVLGICTLLALPAVVCALRLPDTRGRSVCAG